MYRFVIIVYYAEQVMLVNEMVCLGRISARVWQQKRMMSLFVAISQDYILCWKSDLVHRTHQSVVDVRREEGLPESD